MDITISITNTNDLSFDEIKDAITSGLADNGIDDDPSNLSIEEADSEPMSEPGDVTAPTAPPASTPIPEAPVA